MKRYLSLVLLILLAASSMSYASVPTMSSVAATKELALEYYKQNDWEKAVEYLARWEEEAHVIASLAMSAAKPGIGTTALRELSTSQLGLVADYSGISGTLSLERNEAIFLQAKCHYNLGQHKNATECLERLFGYVTHKQWDLWTEGRKLLGEILGLGIE